MTATFQGVGVFQYTPDNKQVYGYTGRTTATTGSANTIFEDLINSEYVKLKIQPAVFSDTSDNIEFIFSFNNIEIYRTQVTSVRDHTPYVPIMLILPPFTTLKIQALAKGSSSKEVGVAITGSVHGTIEQLDLEIKQ